MKSPDGATVSSWTVGLTPPKFPPSSESMTTDVCVVGAGIAGITSAYLLAKEGKRVIVLDEGEVGSGQTGRTSAHLASAIDDRFSEIEKIHSEDGSRIAYQSHAAAIDLIERIARDEKIECEFKRLDGYLFSLPDDPPDLLARELAAAHRAGFAGAEKLDRVQLSGQAVGPCIKFPNQARFHPFKYLYGLTAAATKLGVKIYCGCRVKDVQGADPKKHELAKATIDDGPNAVMAEAIVVATNTPTPINDWFGIYTKQSSYRSYVIAASVPRGEVDDALYWDTGDPYHYVRLEPARKDSGDLHGDDLLLIGGEDHKVGQFEKDSTPFANLEKWAREKFPMIGEVKYRWSGQVQEPADGVAFIGHALTAKENVFVITGDSGMGLTHATLGAKLITDQIMSRPNPWEKLYDPSRKQMNAEYVRENINTAKQYTDLITGGDVKSEDEIGAGSGAVLRSGLSKIAVYRDDRGAVHKCSAICTHLKCVVQWNPIEKSWDCPCHGSRFDPLGKVVMGPAIDDLPKVNE